MVMRISQSVRGCDAFIKLYKYATASLNQCLVLCSFKCIEKLHEALSTCNFKNAQLKNVTKKQMKC